MPVIRIGGRPYARRARLRCQDRRLAKLGEPSGRSPVEVGHFRHPNMPNDLRKARGRGGT